MDASKGVEENTEAKIKEGKNSNPNLLCVAARMVDKSWWSLVS
jgi:hypothetical protein